MSLSHFAILPLLVFPAVSPSGSASASEPCLPPIAGDPTLAERMAAELTATPSADRARLRRSCDSVSLHVERRRDGRVDVRLERGEHTEARVVSTLAVAAAWVDSRLSRGPAAPPLRVARPQPAAPRGEPPPSRAVQVELHVSSAYFGEAVTLGGAATATLPLDGFRVGLTARGWGLAPWARWDGGGTSAWLELLARGERPMAALWPLRLAPSVGLGIAYLGYRPPELINASNGRVDEDPPSAATSDGGPTSATHQVRAVAELGLSLGLGPGSVFAGLALAPRLGGRTPVQDGAAGRSLVLAARLGLGVSWPPR